MTDEELCATLKSYGKEVPSKETFSKLAAASGKEPSEVGAIYVRIVRGPRLGSTDRRAAQRETVALAQGKQTDLGPAKTQVDKPTLAGAGIKPAGDGRAFPMP